MTYDLYSSIFIRYYILSIHFVIALPLSIVHQKNLAFLSYQALYFVVLYLKYLVIWKGLITVTVILVIAAIEGMCIFLLHWFAILCRVDRINFKCAKVFR